MEDKEKSLAGKIIENANPVDFARGRYDGAIARPLLSIVQLSESNGARTGKSGKPVPASGPDSSQDKTIAHQAGVMAGQIVDFSVLALASHGALKPVLKESLNGTAGTAAKMFAAGAVDGGLLTASKADQNERHGLLGARLENALVSGSTFAVMGAVGKSLEGVKLLEQEALISKGLKSALAGASGGVVSAYGNALGENRLASGSEVLSAAGQYALFSLGFQALGAGIGKAAAHPKVESLYYRAKWEMHDGAVEAR